MCILFGRLWWHLKVDVCTRWIGSFNTRLQARHALRKSVGDGPSSQAWKMSPALNENTPIYARDFKCTHIHNASLEVIPIPSYRRSVLSEILMGHPSKRHVELTPERW